MKMTNQLFKSGPLKSKNLPLFVKMNIEIETETVCRISRSGCWRQEADAWGLLDGAVVKNPPANSGDTGSSPGPGRSHMPWSD